MKSPQLHPLRPLSAHQFRSRFLLAWLAVLAGCGCEGEIHGQAAGPSHKQVPAIYIQTQPSFYPAGRVQPLIGHEIALHAPGPCITANIGAINLTIIDYYFRLIMKMRQFENLIENG